MKVILTQAIDKLGKAGDCVNVADGYARNYLLPKNIAKEATPGVWTSKIDAAAAWVADAVADVRKHDETLPLHGCKVVDLCAGGLGGYGPRQG